MESSIGDKDGCSSARFLQKSPWRFRISRIHYSQRMAVTHMDEQLLLDPSKFDPTRFEKQAPPFSFVAFGGGPRICPGYEFAKIETLATIHYLVTQFTWKLCCTDNSFSRKPFPVFRRGLPIRTKKSYDQSISRCSSHLNEVSNYRYSIRKPVRTRMPVS